MLIEAIEAWDNKHNPHDATKQGPVSLASLKEPTGPPAAVPPIAPRSQPVATTRGMPGIAITASGKKSSAPPTPAPVPAPSAALVSPPYSPEWKPRPDCPCIADVRSSALPFSANFKQARQMSRSDVSTVSACKASLRSADISETGVSCPRTRIAVGTRRRRRLTAYRI